MDEPVIRRATPTDVDELLAMRHDFTFEDGEVAALSARPEYEAEFRAFCTEAIERGGWDIWVAEIDGRVASHVYVALIDKVPRPVRENRRIAYLTNVYTRPEYRGRGIGARLVRRAQEAAREADVELIVVWPSDESVEFYKRLGFEVPDDSLIWEAP